MLWRSKLKMSSKRDKFRENRSYKASKYEGADGISGLRKPWNFCCWKLGEYSWLFFPYSSFLLSHSYYWPMLRQMLGSVSAFMEDIMFVGVILWKTSEKPCFWMEFVPDLKSFSSPWDLASVRCWNTSSLQNEIEYKIRRCFSTEILVSLYLQFCMMVSKGFTLQFMYFLVFPMPYEIQKSASFKKWCDEILTKITWKQR